MILARCECGEEWGSRGWNLVEREIVDVGERQKRWKREKQERVSRGLSN